MDSEDPTPPRVPLQSATLNLAARQQSEDPRVLTEKEQNEEKAKARGLGGISFGGKRYWYDRKTDTIYERNSATSAVGNKLGRFLPEGSKGKIVSDSEYAEAKK